MESTKKIREGQVEGFAVINERLAQLETQQADKNFVYTQNIPDDVWTIVHTLNKFPSVSVKDSAGTLVLGQIDYIDTTTIKITFSGSFSGVAILN